MTILGQTASDKSNPSSSNPATGELGKDLLTLQTVPRQHMFRLLQIAQELKADPRPGRSSQLLKGLTLGLIFEKPSTRTRVSFEAGMNQLGGQALFLSSEKIQLSRGESLADTAMVLSRYLDGLVVRTFEQSTLEEWARHATIPVINGLTDLSHPCQALADLMTILEKKGSLKGVKLAYLGDGNNIANSLIEAGAKVGMHITIGCPPDYMPNTEIVKKSREEANETGAVIEITSDATEAARNADALYTDVWTSMGQEEEQAQRRKTLAPYQLNEAIVATAKSDAIVLHCLPAHRGEEITEAVIDGPQSAVLDQAENRLHVQKAILTEWLGRPCS